MKTTQKEIAFSQEVRDLADFIERKSSNYKEALLCGMKKSTPSTVITKLNSETARNKPIIIGKVNNLRTCF